jgi:hypothetical protein
VSKNFSKLAIKDLLIDPAYQRELDEPRVDAMAKKFDESRIGVPVVSLRKDGKFYVLDGQHRSESARRAGLGDLKIMCEVHNGLSQAEEAELFLKLNNGRKTVQAFDKYRARMTANDPVAVEFTRIVNSLGLRIGQGQGKNTINAVLAIESAHRRNRNLELTLSVLKRWGGGGQDFFEGALLKDMSCFLADYSECDVQWLVDKLARVDVGRTTVKIKALHDSIKNRRLAANSVFCEIYNHRRGKKDLLLAVDSMVRARA